MGNLVTMNMLDKGKLIRKEKKRRTKVTTTRNMPAYTGYRYISIRFCAYTS